MDSLRVNKVDNVIKSYEQTTALSLCSKLALFSVIYFDGVDEWSTNFTAMVDFGNLSHYSNAFLGHVTSCNKTLSQSANIVID
jgi:hypothetical protein